MGLNHPRDLDAWTRWARPSLARRAVATIRRGRQGTPPLAVLSTGPEPRILVVLDSASPSSQAALLAPVAHLQDLTVAYLGPPEVLETLGRGQGETLADGAGLTSAWGGALASVTHVLSTGHYLAAGSMAYQRARERAVEFVVVQHGLLTPHAPPLPAGSTLAAFSDADAAFWQSGRDDLQAFAAGSQALWAAGHRGAPTGDGSQSDGSSPLVFLGQLHGRELGRRSVAQQTVTFLRRNPGAVYRPHPQEKDVVSRATHRWMQRQGTDMDLTGRPLTASGADVVSVFSTGVLEALATGRRGWVFHDDPPPWLSEFWDRYGMVRWVDERPRDRQVQPTAGDWLPQREPARIIADHVRGTRQT